MIERTISLGSPARRLALVELGGEVTVGQAVQLVSPSGEAGPEIGRVTSAQPGRALALVRKMHAKEGTEVAAGNLRGRITALAPFK